MGLDFLCNALLTLILHAAASQHAYNGSPGTDGHPVNDVSLLQTHVAIQPTSKVKIPLDAYVIAKQEDSSNFDGLLQTLNNSFRSVIFSDPFYVKWADVENMFKNGTVDEKYHSPLAAQMGREKRMPREVGVTLAHRKVLQQVVDRHDGEANTPLMPWAAVFEPDAILRSDFSERVAALQAHLPSLLADLIYMGHCYESCPFSSQDAIDVGGGVHVVQSKHPVCAHAYLISAKGAKTFLKLTEPIEDANDETMLSAVGDGVLHSLSMCPRIARQPWQQEDAKREVNKEVNSSKLFEVHVPSEAHVSSEQPWECHDYIDGQSDDWCMITKHLGKYEYAFTSGRDDLCGPCWCCKRKQAMIM